MAAARDLSSSSGVISDESVSFSSGRSARDNFVPHSALESTDLNLVQNVVDHHRDLKRSLLLHRFGRLEVFFQTHKSNFLSYDPGMDRLEELTGGYPPIGTTHLNGDRIYGFTTGYARDLLEAQTPSVSALKRSSITEFMGEVRIGDRLSIAWDGKRWTVHSNAGALLGTLSWASPGTNEAEGADDTGAWVSSKGTLVVQRVFVSAEMTVVNCGGVAYPLSRDGSMDGGGD